MRARLNRRAVPPSGLPGLPLTRITYVVDTPGYGGAEIYLQHLLRGGVGRVQAQLLVARPGVPQLAAVAAAAGVNVAGFRPVRGKVHLIRLARLAVAIARTDADVVHVNMTTATNNRFAIAASWLAGKPVVATVHTPLPLGGWRHTVPLRWLYGRLRAVVAVSAEVRRLLIEELHVPPARVHLISNGVDVVPVVASEPAPMIRLLAVGRLESEKGYDVLVEAIRLLVRRDVAVQLVVAGDGSEREALLAAAGGLPIQLPGFIADSGDLWRDADIFCLPSRYEGLPFALLEAMMRGVPCVATAVGDVVTALGDTGVVVPPDDPVALADAIEALAADPLRRNRLGAAARARAIAWYSAESMVARTLELTDIRTTAAALRGLAGLDDQADLEVPV